MKPCRPAPVGSTQPTYVQHPRARLCQAVRHSLHTLLVAASCGYASLCFNSGSKILQRASKKAEKDEKTERLKVKRAIEKGNIEGAKIYAQVRVLGPPAGVMCSRICVSPGPCSDAGGCAYQNSECFWHCERFATGQHCRPYQRRLAHGLKKAVLWAAQNAIRKKSEATNYLRLGSRLDAVVSRLDTQVPPALQLRCRSCICAGCAGIVNYRGANPRRGQQLRALNGHAPNDYAPKEYAPGLQLWCCIADLAILSSEPASWLGMHQSRLVPENPWPASH